MRIKVIQLNIWQGGRLFGQVVQFLQKEQPDVLIMQEVRNGPSSVTGEKYHTIDALQKYFAFPSVYYSPVLFETIDGERVDSGNAILSRFSFISSQTIFYKGSYRQLRVHTAEEFIKIPRNIQHVRLQLGNNIIEVINNHGIWGLDGEDNEKRLRMSETIVREIKARPNVILAGDFNVSPHTRTILNIEQYLTNVFKDELTSTFNMRRKTDAGYATAVVDYIFVSKDITVIDHYCPDVDISDHLPLVAVLEV